MVTNSYANGNLSKDLYAIETELSARTESGIFLSYGTGSTPAEDLELLVDKVKETIHYVASIKSFQTLCTSCSSSVSVYLLEKLRRL